MLRSTLRRSMVRPKVDSVEALNWVTGERSTDHTDTQWAVAGTDLGIAWDDGNGRVLLAFGDTYNPRNPENLGGGGGGLSGDWRCNVLGISTDTDLSDGLHLDGFVEDRPGHAKQLIPRKVVPSEREETVIPTGACSVGSRQYMAYMSVRDWGAAGTWHTNYAGLAYSDDNGENWAMGPVWYNTPGWSQPFQMCTLVHSDGYVYLFGTPNGRRGALYLARVPDDKVLDLAEHEQWHGTGWGKNPDLAVPIVDDEVSETSVAFHTPSGHWLLAYLQDQAGLIVMRTATDLVGPWSEPQTLVSGADYPMLYGGFWHPWTLNGNEPCFLISQWLEYNSRLMKVTFA